jgi:hypothetical protein
MLTVAGQRLLIIQAGTEPGGAEGSTIFVPIILSSSGLYNSFFTSEMTLTNRGSQNATVILTYTAAFGAGSGSAVDFLEAGRQRVIPDAIGYLRSIGLPIPSAGNQGGTLVVSFSGLSSPSDGAVTVRTTTRVPEGRAGLAYAGVPIAAALAGPSYLPGLRQNEKDRSNVAIQNAGTASQGGITLRLTVISGDPESPLSGALPDEMLAPGEFRQITEILKSNGLSLGNGFVRIERVSGSAPYYAYGVINDQFNSDGSFIPPIPENALVGKRRLTLPVVVEANEFSSEVILTNWSSVRKNLRLLFVAEGIQTPNTTATLLLEINPNEQLVVPDFVAYLRGQGLSGIGPRGGSYVGAMFVEAVEGDLAGVFASARTSSPGGGGRFGLFYGSIAEGSGSNSTVSILDLQQNLESRSNLAIVNTGEIDANSNTFKIELFNGATGAKVNTIEGITVKAGGWKQLGAILSDFAPGVSQGYASITRTSGNNPFIAYGVINDGAHAGERTGDGAFIPGSPAQPGTVMPFPPEVEAILNRLLVPSGLHLSLTTFERPEYVTGGGCPGGKTPANYNHELRRVELNAEWKQCYGGTYEEMLFWVTHEISHAHQHRMILNAGLSVGGDPNARLVTWLETPEGRAFMAAGGRSNLPKNASVNPIEDFANVCASWYLRRDDLQRYDPVMYEFARQWLLPQG